MTDQPFSPGGIIPSRGPGSDFVPVLIGRHEPVIPLDALRRWHAGELTLQDLLRESGAGPIGEVPDGGNDDKS